MLEPSRQRYSTLLASFLHFDLSFMLWVLVGALGIPLAEAASLTPFEKGLIVGAPLLTGSLLRVPVGILADRIGGKRVGLAMLGFLFVPLSLAAIVPPSFPALLAIGALLGVAGASFAVALPLASRWFPPEKQGLAMGVAAAGNSGTVITNLVAPRIAAHVGAAGTFALAMIPLALVLVLFAFLAHEPPRPATKPGGSLLAGVAREPDAWRLALFYSVTFGGYVGMASFAPLFLRDQYALEATTAGTATAALAFAGSLSRPLGGALADRIGGTRLLIVLLLAIAAAYGAAISSPSLPVMLGVLGTLFVCLGLGNGAVFQVVPLRFSREVGTVTGLVGAIGGVGGFFLPSLLGAAREGLGSFSAGFAGLALLASVSGIVLIALCAPSGAWARGKVPGAPALPEPEPGPEAAEPEAAQ